MTGDPPALTIQSDTEWPADCKGPPMRARGNIAVFALPTIVATWFLYGFAFKYLTPSPERYGIYWERHDWLYLHVAAGVFALLLGPAQLWLGLNRRTTMVHRTLGILYVLSVGIGGASAYYLAAHNDFGWVFGVGLGAMATVWILSTALATISIVLRQVTQHREWMVRSYVVTFGFVFFRIAYELMDILEVGNMAERMTAASWLAWSIPLFLAEFILQGRKVFLKQQPEVVRLSEAPYSLLPEREAHGFALQRTEAPQSQ